jgi:ABC-type transport system involved in multi-copper enzyme maturation permease subunit
MTTIAWTADRSLPSSDLLKLRRRRGLVVVTSLLTVVAMAITYAIIEIVHLSSPAKHGPAGGVENLGHGSWVAATLGAVAAVLVGSIAGAGDLEAGVYRDLVVTGRSRLALYRSRALGGLLFLLAFVTAAYALTAVATVVFAGGRPVPGTHLLLATGLWVVLQAAFYYLLAFGTASLLGSRAYTIGLVLGFRLVLTPILASISALGVGRELLPGVAMQALAPAALGDTIRQGPVIPMSAAAIALVLLAWAALVVGGGAWRDVSRDA